VSELDKYCIIVNAPIYGFISAGGSTGNINCWHQWKSRHQLFVHANYQDFEAKFRELFPAIWPQVTTEYKWPIWNPEGSNATYATDQTDTGKKPAEVDAFPD
jgi:hypothetical protein